MRSWAPDFTIMAFNASTDISLAWRSDPIGIIGVPRAQPARDPPLVTRHLPHGSVSDVLAYTLSTAGIIGAAAALGRGYSGAAGRRGGRSGALGSLGLDLERLRESPRRPRARESLRLLESRPRPRCRDLESPRDVFSRGLSLHLFLHGVHRL